ncbi:MAG: hypothetical protein NVS2B8_14690 [Vulcanimicrobiaceae bacterium]
MRELSVLILAIVTLGGCSMTVAESIPRAHHAKSYAVHFVPAEKPRALVGATPGLSLKMDTASDGITVRAAGGATPTLANIGAVGGAVTTALTLPTLVDALRQDLNTALLVLGMLGVLNIALIARVLSRRRTAAFAIATGEVASAASADARPRCSCNAPISSRSRSGRCRRCARTARARPAPPKIDRPLTLTVPAVDESDVEVLETRAVLTASRLGSRGEYYSVVK